jgi:hypothetical protein
MLPFVKVLEQDPGVPVKDDLRGRSLHRSNTINVAYANGLKYDGKGVAISLADDGNIGPHIDFKGRLTDLTNGNFGTHGDMCSGIAVGAANLDPRYPGMANGAHLNLFDIGGYPQITDAEENFTNLNSVITSTSYSQGCNEYTATTASGDDKLLSNSQFNFIFSGGNNGIGNCGYGAGAGWGNITGGYKVGKNVIAAGNTDQNGSLDNSSSRGPAPDGRIKPDICANGTNHWSTDEDYTYSVGGGTSAACPGIAGITAQIYQAYKEITNSSNPDGGLIKTILLNTADDRGRPGPDFEYGWGMVNARKALSTIQENRYKIDSISQGDSVEFLINIPAGVRNTEMMVYWTDPAGDPTSTISLVNNLDIKLKNAQGQTFLPWILNSSPTVAALTSNATTGIDNLNNMEQVSLNDPAPGVYRLVVYGKSIPEGPQKFFMTYLFETNALKLTYPLGGEGLVQTESELIRWDAFGTAGTFQLAYSGDNGSNWTTITNNLAGTNRQLNWTVPNVTSGNVIMRLVRGTDTSYTERPFTISRLASNLRVTKACVDSLTIAWNAVTGATAYEVSLLGTKYMDSVTTVSGLTAKIPYNFSIDNWFSVSPVFANGAKGRRAIAIRKTPGLVGCAVASDVGISSVISPRPQTTYPCPSFANHPVKVRVRNFGTAAASNFPLFFKLGSAATVSQTFTSTLNPGDSVEFIFTQTVNLIASTNYTLQTWTKLVGDFNTINDSTISTFRTTPATSSTLTQNFQLSLFPPSGWGSINQDNNRTWVRTASIAGPLGFGTNAALMDNFGYLTSGSVDALLTPMVDFASNPNPVLLFDIAYASGSQRRDTLEIRVSTDCGATFIPTNYRKGGIELSTVGARSTRFIPANVDEWRTDTLNLNFTGGQKVIIQFINKNRGGNALYIDNVRSASFVVSNNDFKSGLTKWLVFPNPAQDKITLSFGMESRAQSWKLIAMDGKVKAEGALNGIESLELDVHHLPKGLYLVQVMQKDGEVQTRKLVLE